MGGKCKTEPECTLHPLLPQVNRSPGHDDDENDDVDDDDDDNDDDNDDYNDDGGGDDVDAC